MAPARRADEGDLLVVPPQLRRHPWEIAAFMPGNGGRPAELTNWIENGELRIEKISRFLNFQFSILNFRVLLHAQEGLHRVRRPPSQRRRLSALRVLLLLVSIVALFGVGYQSRRRASIRRWSEQSVLR